MRFPVRLRRCSEVCVSGFVSYWKAPYAHEIAEKKMDACSVSVANIRCRTLRGDWNRSRRLMSPPNVDHVTFEMCASGSMRFRRCRWTLAEFLLIPSAVRHVVDSGITVGSCLHRPLITLLLRCVLPDSRFWEMVEKQWPQKSFFAFRQSLFLYSTASKAHVLDIMSCSSVFFGSDRGVQGWQLNTRK